MSKPALSIIIPAAGASKRLGQAKQLVELNGVPLIQNAVSIAQQIHPLEIIVVTGAREKAVRNAITSPDVRLVHNRDWAAGMGGSIAVGAKEIHSKSKGLMILLCDQWRIRPQDLQVLAGTWQSDPARIVCATAGGINMPPVIFPANLLDHLRGLKGSKGARSLLKEQRELLTPVPLPNAEFDLDTEIQLDELRSAGAGVSKV